MKTFTITPYDTQEQISVCHFPYQGEGNSPPILHWAHANGFNAQTYTPLLAPLSETMDVYASDLRGHGHTTLTADPDRLGGWEVYRDDLIALLESLHKEHEQKIWLGGHSMGGFASLYAACTRPDLVAGLVLADPVILPRFTSLAYLLAHLLRRSTPLILETAALRRRAVWDSVAQIHAAYKGRGAFTNWKEGFLENYLEGGLIEKEGAFHLACAPAWEAANYRITKASLHRQIKNLRLPFTLLLAEYGSTTRNLNAFRDVKTDKHIEVVQGASHFLPMEYPDVLREAIIKRIKQ